MSEFFCSFSEIKNPKDSKKGGLYLGNYETIQDSLFLTQHKITHVISLTKYHKLFLNHINEYNIEHLALEIDDDEESDILCLFEKTGEFIQKGLKEGNVLVHCIGGVSRSASVVIAFLIGFENMPFQEALKFVQSKRKQVYPNQGFLEQILVYEEKLKNKK